MVVLGNYRNEVVVVVVELFGGIFYINVIEFLLEWD